MGLLDVFGAVQDQLRTNLGNLSPVPPMPKFEIGEVSLAKEGDYPRIVWVPRTETMTGADAQGGDGIGNPRPLWKRACRVEAVVWEKDIAACEALANHLVAAMHDGQWGEYVLTNASWNTAAVVQRGIAYTLAFVIAIPFTREKDTLSLPITDFPLTETFIPLEATG